MNAEPIFIGGLAHSGKTPLRIALSAHPRLHLTRRTGMWNRYLGKFGDLGQSTNLDRCLAAMLRDPGVQALQPDPVRIRRELRFDVPTYGRLFGLIHGHHAERLGKTRWGEQLGVIEHFADPIFESFPEARMIHMIGDPRARQAAAAAKSRYRTGKVGWETARWLRSVEVAERNRRRYRDRYLILRHENLVAEPQAVLHQVASFLGEDFHPRMLAAIEAADLSSNSSVADAALPGAEARCLDGFVELYAEPQLRSLGYRLQGKQSRGPRFYLWEWPLNRAGMTAWRTLRSRSLARWVEGE